MTDDKKRYLIARKMKYLWEGDLGHAVGVSIAICHSRNKLVYSILGSGYECGFVISWINIGAQIARKRIFIL